MKVSIVDKSLRGDEEYYCPYCSHFDNTLGFNTVNQQTYIQAYLQTVVAEIINKTDSVDGRRLPFSH
ncbi:hypothetical protein PAAL109150_17390 [Paenibacillus alkaliterrae]